MATIGSLSADLTLNSASFIGNLSKSADAMQRTAQTMQQQTSQMSGALTSVNSAASTLRTGLGALGVGFSISAISGFVRSTFEAADALKGASDAAGISAEALQRWRFAAEQSGSNAAQMDVAVRTLNERLGDFARTGTGQAAKALTELGVAAQIQSGQLQGTTAVMEAVVNSLASITDPARQASLATDLFGRTAGPEMAGLLKEGVAGIEALRKSTAVLSDEQVARADEIGDRWAKMTTQIKTNLQSLTLTLADAAARGAENQSKLADAYEKSGDQIIASVTRMVSEVDDQLNNRLSQAAESSASATTSMAIAWRRLYDELVGQSIVPDMVTEIEGWLDRLHESMRLSAKLSTGDFLREFEKLDETGETAEAVSGSAEEMERIFNRAAENIQDSFADAFTSAFEGNLTSAQDFADSLKSIFAQTGGQIAAALTIKPVLSGIFDAQGNLKSLTGPGGMFHSATAPTATGLAQSAAFGGATGFAVGSSLFPNQAGQTHTGAAIGGGIGGAIGGAAGSTFGPGGAFLGSMAGGALGGFIGRQFGAGKGQDNKVFIRGGLGANLGGTSAASGLSNDLDRSLRQLLTGAQETAVNSMLAVASGVRVQFDKTMSANDMARIASSRLGPAASALGFNVGAITTGTAEDQLANLQEALAAKNAIRDLVGTLTPFGTQIHSLIDQFDEVTRTAERYGISLEGVAAAQQLALDALARQQRSQFNSVAEAVGAISPVDAALNELQIRMEEFATQATLLNIPLGNLAETHAKAAQAIRDQFFVQQAALQVQQKGADQLAEESRQRRRQMHDVGTTIGIWTEFDKQLLDLQLDMEQAATDAARLGLSIDTVTRKHQDLIKVLQRQQQQQTDALLLSIDAPFKSMLSELDTLGLELQQSLMNPLERFEASAQHFRDITTAALAGSTTAIDQFDDAARDFIATAEQTGASAGRVKAIQEVEDARQLVAAQINQAQVQAGKGVEGAIQAASNRQVDTLREVVAEVRLVKDELRRLTRSLT